MCRRYAEKSPREKSLREKGQQKKIPRKKVPWKKNLKKGPRKSGPWLKSPRKAISIEDVQEIYQSKLNFKKNIYRLIPPGNFTHAPKDTQRSLDDPTYTKLWETRTQDLFSRAPSCPGLFYRGPFFWGLFSRIRADVSLYSKLEYRSIFDQFLITQLLSSFGFGQILMKIRISISSKIHDSYVKEPT